MSKVSRSLARVSLLLVVAGVCAVSLAEQKQHLGAWDVHYVVVASTFFNEEIAERYDIVRGRDRAIMNVSILGQDQTPVAVTIEGVMINLLGQRQSLAFREIREGDAIYYLAPVKHDDREMLRFEVQFTAPGDVSRLLRFQQQMFWDGR